MANTQTTNKAPDTQKVSVDDLSKKIKETTDELNQLKKGLSSLSLEQQNDKLSDIENAILECSEDLASLEKDGSVSVNKKQLNTLKSQINTLTSSKESLKKQIEKQTTEALTKLNQTVTKESDQKNENGEEEGEKKSWLGRQWSGLWSKDEWKEHPGKNALRALSGIGIAAGVLKLGRRIFGGKHDYESEIPGYSKMSRKEKRAARKALRKQERADRKADKAEEKGEFRQRPFGRFLKGTGIFLGVGSGIYYLAHGIYTKNWGLKDLFDWEKGKKLTFDEAFQAAKGSMANYGDGTMAYGMDLEFHEDTSEIEAYGQRIKVSKEKNGKIDGLNVEFKKYEHMISTAILIAYLKKNYAGQCKNNNPFSWSGGWRGNMDVSKQSGKETAVDGSGNGGRIVGISAGAVLGIVAGIFGGLQTGVTVGAIGATSGYLIGRNFDTDNVLNTYMPELDSENGIKIFSGYLNGLGGREAGNQDTEKLPDSQLKDELKQCIETIQKTDDDNELRGRVRNLTVEQDPNDTKKCTIKAYGLNIPAEVVGDGGNKKVKFLGISGGNPEVKCDLSKGNIANKELPAKEAIYFASFIGFMVKEFHNKSGRTPHIYYRHTAGMLWPGLYINDSRWNDTRVLKEDTIKERMPTLYEQRENFATFLNDGVLEASSNACYWREK